MSSDSEDGVAAAVGDVAVDPAVAADVEVAVAVDVGAGAAATAGPEPASEVSGMKTSVGFGTGLVRGRIVMTMDGTDQTHDTIR